MSTARKKSFREETPEERKSSEKMSKRMGSPLVADLEKDRRILSPDQNQPRTTHSNEGGMSDTASQRSVESTKEALFYKETEGAMRDRFVVDINTIDGKPFKGTVTRTEAVRQIFVKALGFNSNELHGVTPSFKGHPVVIFKTKEIFNIDERLAGKSNFIYQRKIKTESGEKIEEMSCTIKGIRGKDPSEREASAYTWLKIEGADYLMKEDQFKDWLSEYGFLVSGITEDIEKIGGISSGEEESQNEDDFSTGIYSAKIKLNKEIPQLIPMYGKKIKIYHKGIKKQCVNCYETGHFKKDCKNDRKDWLDYIDGFMLSASLPDELYGNWSKMVEDWRQKNPERHAKNRKDREEEVREQLEIERRREEEVREIARILQEQKLSSKPRPASGKGVGKEDSEEQSQHGRKKDQQDEDQSDKEFAKPAGRRVAKKTEKEKKSGRGRGRGRSQSLHSSPDKTPSNEKCNE